MSLWEQRLETNNWEKAWFKTFVNVVTQGKIQQGEDEEYEDYEARLRKCFFNRIDWLCFILTFVVLLISAGASLISAASSR